MINLALSIVGLLPTPQLRTAALLATLRTEVTHRSGKEHTMTVCLPATEVINIDAPGLTDEQLKTRLLRAGRVVCPVEF